MPRITGGLVRAARLPRAPLFSYVLVQLGLTVAAAAVAGRIGA